MSNYEWVEGGSKLHVKKVEKSEVVKLKQQLAEKTVSHDRLTAMLKQLDEANKVIDFYADTASWKREYHGDYVYKRIDDLELNINGSDEHCCGKRAREYKQKYGVSDVSDV